MRRFAPLLLALAACAPEPEICAPTVTPLGATGFSLSWTTEREGTSTVRFGYNDTEWTLPATAGTDSATTHTADLWGLPITTDGTWSAETLDARGRLLAECSGTLSTQGYDNAPTGLDVRTYEAQDTWEAPFLLGALMGIGDDQDSGIALFTRTGDLLWFQSRGNEVITAEARFRDDYRTIVLNEGDRRRDEDVGAVYTYNLSGELTESRVTPEGHHSFVELADGTLLMLMSTEDSTQSFAIEYQIDANTQTLTEVARFGQDLNTYAYALGQAHRLPNGNTLINWGLARTIQERTPQDTVVWEAQLPGGWGWGETELFTTFYPE